MFSQVSLILSGGGRLAYPWYQILSVVRVSLVPCPFWGRVYKGVGYLEDKVYPWIPYPQIPNPPGVEATSAVGTHPTGMLSCWY